MVAVAKTYVERGDRFIDEGDMDSALAMFESAVALSPDDLYALCGLGGVLALLGRSREAAAVYSDVIDRSPNDPGARFGRACALSHAIETEGLDAFADSDVATTLADYAAALRSIDVDYIRAGVLYSRGEFLAAIGETERSLHDLETAVELAPDDNFLIMQLAHARSKAGDEEGVLAAVKLIVDQIEREDEAFLDRLTQPPAPRPPRGGRA